MSYDTLDKVNSLSDLKSLDEKEIQPLCDDIRAFLLEKVERCGGHLASNLGVVELSVALHRVFDSPRDHIIFDVGHQAYVHKMLTGRKERFDDLRKPGGLSGFTLMKESVHDAFGAGHSSTSVSAALGYAESDKLRGREDYTVCVIGDGAYTGGMVHEAINNCHPDLRLIIILNENGMSISSNKGAFASYLSRVRTSKGYIKAKNRTTSFLNVLPLLGKPIKLLLSGLKRVFKKILFRTNYFEDLGFYYMGPVDGNDYKKVCKALSKAKALNKCVIVHMKTVKGKGCDNAERSPEQFHSVKSGGVEGGTYHDVFSEAIVKLASEDDRVVAVTAAMGLGTGLSKFGESFPDRYFDVGIAEEHALTFSAGLAAAGQKPYAAIYSTFLQRGYDNIIHDIALQGLPVRIFIDRAGIAASDGATHHGIFDVAFLSHIPGIEIISPACYSSLRRSVEYSCECDHPLAVRYPNAKESVAVAEYLDRCHGEVCDFRYDFDIKDAPRRIIVTYGALAEGALRARDILKGRGIDVGIIIAERIKPYEPLCRFIASFANEDTHILYAEEGIKNGGAAMITESVLSSLGVRIGAFDIAAIDDNFVVPAEICDIYDYAGLSAERLAGYFK